MNFRKWSGFVVFLGSLYILWQLREFLLLLLTAVIVANALNVLVVKVQELSEAIAEKFQQPRLHLQRTPAVFVSLFLVGLVIWLAFAIVIPPFIGQFQILFERLNSGLYQIDDWLDIQITQIEQNLNIELNEQMPDLSGLINEIPTLFNEIISRGWTFFSDSLKVLLNILLLVVLTLMFLADPQPYRKGLVRLFPSFYRRRIDEILALCAEDLRGWVAGIMFNMLCIGVCSFIGLSVLGLSLALPQAILAGLLTFIPNIGPALSVVPPIMIALLEDPWKVWAVLLLYFGIQQLEGNVLTPWVMSRQVSLLPAITLLAQVLFAVSLQLGFLGLFLALPLTVIAQVLVREIVVKDILDTWEEIPAALKVTAPLAAVEEAKAIAESDSFINETTSKQDPKVETDEPTD